jgi:hypothetical protein
VIWITQIGLLVQLHLGSPKPMDMKKNMGNVDRVIRLIAAAVIAILYFSNIISGTVGLVLLIFAGVFVLTSFISFCPLYAPLGISTCKTPKAAR